MNKIIILSLVFLFTGICIADSVDHTPEKPLNEDLKGGVDAASPQKTEIKDTNQNDLYFEILKSQQNWSLIIVTAMGAIFILATGLTIFYQLFRNNKLIKEKVEEEFEEKLKDFEIKTENIVKIRVQKETEVLKSDFQEESDRLQENTELTQAETYRLHGIFLKESHPETALLWFIRAFQVYFNRQDYGMSNVMVDYVKETYEKLESDKITADKQQIEEMIGILNEKATNFSMFLSVLKDVLKEEIKEDTTNSVESNGLTKKLS
jgi:hypothetical protein